MLELEFPWALIALPLPFLIYWASKPVNTEPQHGAALHIPFYHTLSSLAGEQHKEQESKRHHLLMPALIWTLLLFAASHPLWLGEPIDLQGSGRDLMMAVDLSGSMEQEDMILNGQTVNRLVATKSVMNDFIIRRRGDRLGLILFGSQAYLQTPLTFDRSTVRTLMAESVIGMAGIHTAIGDALGLAVKHLRKRPEDSRVLILLTDGANTAGEISPLQAAQIARDEGIKIYTVGLGADEIMVPSLFGSRRVNPSADLDEKTLQEMAGMTGGRYFRARNTEELNKIYDLLDQLEPSLQEEKTFRPSKNLFYWPLG
ncbi:MAG: vWA domain-containing protein, partial [Endozoicomonas sp.]